MTKLCTFNVWDDDGTRGQEIVRLLTYTLQECKIKAEIFLHSEPPMLARNNMTGRTPAIEFEGNVWQTKGKQISQEGISTLVARIFMD